MTNTGDKPIYFLYIILGTNVKVDTGLEMVYPLSYGRAELGDIVTKATSDDVPIKPGETNYLNMGEVPYWEKGVREKRWPDSTKFTADIQVLSLVMAPATSVPSCILRLPGCSDAAICLS